MERSAKALIFRFAQLLVFKAGDNWKSCESELDLKSILLKLFLLV